jgi:hypothetical protein
MPTYSDSTKNLSRREFVQKLNQATLAALGASVTSLPFIGCQKTGPKMEPAADAVILLWMAGGMCHTETFDPKKYTPFQKGMASNQVISTFPSIPSSVDGLRLSAGLEQIASTMHLGTLLKSYRAADLGFILHTRHQYHWHTCYEPPQSIQPPHLGAWIAKLMGSKNPVMPAFVDIGQRFSVGEGEELKAFHSAGFLGSEYGPFYIPDPSTGLENVKPPAGMDLKRFEARHQLYKNLIQAGPAANATDYQQESLIRSMERAYGLLKSPEAAAFNLADEPKKVYDQYNTGRFGLGCLMARRLIENGSRFVSVTTEYEPFLGWDTHENGHERLVKMKALIDQPIATLIRDLESRDLLNRTLVILATEFSRDMLTEGRPDKKVKDQVEVPDHISELAHYGMHRHFTDGCSMMLWGGGVKKGFVVGETAPERPFSAISQPVKIDQVHQTIYHLLGIPADTSYVVEGRPVYTTPDGAGEIIPAILDKTPVDT